MIPRNEAMQSTRIARAIPRAILFLGMALFALEIWAKEATDTPLNASINTARPSFSGPAMTLEAGHWQWEAGYQYTSNDDDGSDTDAHTLPLLLLRLGVNNRTEINLAWAGFSDIQTSGPDLDGVSDLSIGANYQLTPDDAALALGIFANLSLPVGSDDLSSDEVDPGVGLNWSYSAAQGPSWFGTIVVNSVTGGDERATELGTSVGLAFSLSERVGSYVEYFSVHSDSADSAHSVNGGFTYLLNNDIQLDIYAGGGINKIAADFFIGSGIGWRF